MSEMQPRKGLRASDEERDYVLHVLQQAHAAGRLDVEELGERQDKALAAKYSEEFVSLVEDLPEGREVVAALRPSVAAQPGGPRAVASPGTSNSSLAILSGKELIVPPGVTSYHLMSFMGGDTVDLTRAMAPGVVMIIEAQSVLGGATIMVPPGVQVVDESSAFMGGNSVKRRAKGDGSNGTLVLRGFALLGGHTVKPA